MSLRTAYERFLSNPNPQSLADAASLHYVTSLTSVQDASKIARHLETQDKNIVKKKSWKVISGVEGQSSIALEISTSLEFLENGGAYLPGMDTFIVGHEATLPITHYVSFNAERKISQIRLSWDQGSLLKQVEIIGARGKNWPVFDGIEQIKLIASSSSSAAAVAPDTPPRGRNDESQSLADRSFSPTKRHIRDPHASLDLFGAKPEEERDTSAYTESVAPRASAKPPPREYSELFAAGHEDLAPSPGGSPQKAHRESVIAPKGATNRRFESARLFEEDQDFKEPKIYKTNPARYNHFDLGDADENDPMQFKTGAEPEPKKHVPMVTRTNKGQSQWNFEDFSTPAKVQQKHRDQDQVHFSFDDEPGSDNQRKGVPQHKGRKEAESHFELQDDGSPATRVTHPKARKDAASHFDFTDDATPAPRRIIGRTKAAAGLYADPVFDNMEDDAPLGNITNNAGRQKTFGSQWDSVDEPSANGRAGNENKSTGKGRFNRNTESHWDF